MSSPGELGAEHEGARATALPAERGWEVHLGAGTGRLDVATGTRLLHDLSASIADHGGGTVRWRVPHPTPEHRRIAEANGFAADRRLVQMRRPLPTPWSTDLETRAFEPGVDDDEWLRVNNAAFAWHPEQSAWTPDMLRDRLAEPWFDPNGFLLHPPAGPLDGFCWTKIHANVDPPIGEIFVIGVDPTAAGRGLGRELVLAGLDHLARRGISSAMLYTEADNHRAVGLYERLGFSVHHEIVVFEKSVDQTPTPTAEPIA